MSKFKEYLEMKDTMRSGSGIMKKAYDDLGNDPKSFGDRFSSKDMRTRQNVIMRINSITDIIKNIGGLKEDLSKNYHELKTDIEELNSEILRNQANDLLDELKETLMPFLQSARKLYDLSKDFYFQNPKEKINGITD